jgi:3-oxoacyl-[acyl-carrier-protein] synthase-3
MRTEPVRQPRVKIVDIAYRLPATIVTNEGLAEEHPDWDMERVEARAGVVSRHIAGPDETALDLAVEACHELFARNPGLPAEVDGLVFCTQSPDYVMPPNSSLLHRELALGDDVFAFDTNLACSGYVYCLALAQGLIVAGTCRNIVLVTADTYSKYIHPGDRAARTLFGDAAAVTWLAAANDGTGIVDLLCATSGAGYDKFYIPAGGMRLPKSLETALEDTDASGNTRTSEHITMDGMGVLAFANSKVPPQVRQLLERNAMEVSDLDLVVFHQASRVALESLTRTLGLRSERVFSNLAQVGNTVSASIPIALADARESGRVNPGSWVLLSGFGVGLSWASALMRA